MASSVFWLKRYRNSCVAWSTTESRAPHNVADSGKRRALDVGRQIILLHMSAAPRLQDVVFLLSKNCGDRRAVIGEQDALKAVRYRVGGSTVGFAVRASCTNSAVNLSSAFRYSWLTKSRCAGSRSRKVRSGASVIRSHEVRNASTVATGSADCIARKLSQTSNKSVWHAFNRPIMVKRKRSSSRTRSSSETVTVQLR